MGAWVIAMLRPVRGVVPAVVLVAVCLTAYLPGLTSIPPVDRDESRFAQASRQMFESVALPEAKREAGRHSGGLVVPMVGDQPRLAKPPMVYWLQSASAWVLARGDPARDAIWMYRLPSVVAAIAIVLLTWRIGATMFDGRAAWVGALLLAVCPLVVWEAHQARADMVMTAFSTAALGALWTLWRGAGSSRRARRRQACAACVLWVALALGVLTKGPAPVMVVVLTAVTLSVMTRRWRWLWRTRPVLGVVVMAAVWSPWLLAVADRVGTEALAATVWNEVFVRAGAAREGHWGPPGYHLLLLAVLFWPGSLMTAWAVARAVERVRPGGGGDGGPAVWWRWTERGAESFLLAWLVPSWLVFELIMTKLPHYTMPMYPAIALVTGRGVLAAAGGGRWAGHGQRIGTVVWVVISVMVAVGVPIGLFAIGVRDAWRIVVAGPVWLAAIGAFAACVWRAHRLGPRGAQRWLVLQAGGVVLAAGSWVFVLGALVPGAKRLFVSERLMDELRMIDPAGRRALASIGYHEPSLVFATRGRVRLIERGEEGRWWHDEPEGLLILPRENLLRSHVVVGGTEGINYSRGRWEELAIVESFRPASDGADSAP